MKLKAFYFIVIFTICLSCKKDNLVKEKELKIRGNKSQEISFQCLPRIKDKPNLEKQKIVIYAEKDNDSLVLSKNEMNKIEQLFPLFKSKYYVNPNEAYSSSGIWKDYINQDGKKEHFSFGSEAGQDNFCLVYSYYLKQKNGERKYKAQRNKLIELYRAINGLYEGLNYGGTFYGHQHKRLNAFAEYSIYLLSINGENYNKKYDFKNQKNLYIKLITQYVSDEESKNVYYQMDLVENKPKALKRAKELKGKIDILQKLITNYFYLSQVEDFENNYK